MGHFGLLFHLAHFTLKQMSSNAQYIMCNHRNQGLRLLQLQCRDNGSTETAL
jgi:hypothetical protein